MYVEIKYGGQMVKVDRYMDKQLYYKLRSSSLLVIIRSRILIIIAMNVGELIN